MSSIGDLYKLGCLCLLNYLGPHQNSALVRTDAQLCTWPHTIIPLWSNASHRQTNSVVVMMISSGDSQAAPPVLMQRKFIISVVC